MERSDGDGGAAQPAKSFLKKSVEYLESAEANLVAERYTPAAGDAIHAGISAKDSIVTALTGATGKSKDHAAAAKELRQALAKRPDAATAERALRELIASKGDVEYGTNVVTATKAEPACSSSSDTGRARDRDRASGRLMNLSEAVLLLIRTRSDLHRWSAADAHGRQMHEAVDILEGAAATAEPVEVYAVAHKALASAIKVIARADDSSGIIGDACRRLLGLHPKAAADPACDERAMKSGESGSAAASHGQPTPDVCAGQMVPPAGFEPATLRLGGGCSIP